MMGRLRFALHLAGCCPSCDGTGASGDTAVPGGLCWDCRATGHPHEATRLQLSREEWTRNAMLRRLSRPTFEAELAALHDDYARTIASLDAALTPRELVPA